MEEKVEGNVSSSLESPLIRQSYMGTDHLIWQAKYLGNCSGGLSVGWKVEDSELRAKIGEWLSYPIKDILEFHGAKDRLQTDFIETNRDRIAWGRDRGSTFGGSREEFFNYFLTLAQVTQKRISIFRYYGHSGESKFLFRCDPDMTPELRRDGMSNLQKVVTALLSQQPNVSQIWGFGSSIGDELYPQDVDIALISNQLSTSISSKAGGYTEYLKILVPDLIDDGLTQKEASKYIPYEVAEQLSREAERVGVVLNLSILPPESFNRPTPGSFLEKIVEEVKKGRLLFKK